MGLRLTGMLALSGAILGFFVSLIVPHRYVATSTLRFVHGANVPRDVADTIASRLFAAETLAPLVYRESNLKEMLTIYRNDEVFAIVRAGSRVREVKLQGGARGIDVTFEGDDPERALSIDRELAVAAGKLESKSEMIGTPHTSLTGATAPLTTAIGFSLGMLAGVLAWTLSSTGRTPSQPN